jgi:hydrogenase nickel incorporation protein HypB
MVLVKVMKAVSEKNDETARAIRLDLATRGLSAINIISSPGSGKTTLLEETAKRLNEDMRIAVIVGDPFGTVDGERLEAGGARTIQLNTEGSCHLTAPMVKAALEELSLESIGLIFIENIGNLICPAAWDLGEAKRVTLLSVAEGADKVAKYRKAFFIADAVVISKIDLADRCDFDLQKAVADIKAINPNATIILMSAKTGEGMQAWLEWLMHTVLLRG